MKVCSIAKIYKNVKYFVRLIVFKSPRLFFFIYSRTQFKRRLVKESTDIVIEGFPRSANSYALHLFLEYQKRSVRVAHHMHAQAQIIEAVRLNIPVIVLIRRPEDAIKSLIIRERDIIKRAIVLYYINFYKDLLTIRNKIVFADFDEVTSNFGGVIRRVNDKYKTNFIVPSSNRKAVDEEIFNKLREINIMNENGDQEKIAIPNQKKEILKKSISFSSRDLYYLSKAKKIYEYYRKLQLI